MRYAVHAVVTRRRTDLAGVVWTTVREVPAFIIESGVVSPNNENVVRKVASIIDFTDPVFQSEDTVVVEIEPAEGSRSTLEIGWSKITKGLTCRPISQLKEG